MASAVKKNTLKRIAITASVAVLVLLVMLIIGEVVIHRAGPILKGRIEETLRAQFHGRVEIRNMDVSVLRGLEVTGDHLQIYAPGVRQPLIAIDQFSFHSGLTGLFVKPMHVAKVRVTGLVINIPPPEMRQNGPGNTRQRDKVKIDVDEIVCERSRLVIGTSRPDKDPKAFELTHIDLHDVGRNTPWKYNAVLTNAIPRGDIHATGTFGPWDTDSPGDSAVTGNYTFQHADLNPIKGIGGILSSTGDFKGKLDRIEVEGTTETPDFSLDTANHGMPLETQFHAIVDGITGDTYLDPVEAKLKNSHFTARGQVINIKGEGHRIELDLDVPGATRRFPGTGG